MQIKSLQVCKHPTVNLIGDVAKFHEKPIEGVCNEEQTSSAVHMQLDITLLESQRERVPPKDNTMELYGGHVLKYKKQKKTAEEEQSLSLYCQSGRLGLPVWIETATIVF